MKCVRCQNPANWVCECTDSFCDLHKMIHFSESHHDVFSRLPMKFTVLPSFALQEKQKILSNYFGIYIEGHLDCISSLLIVPNSTSVVSGSRDSSIRIWDYSTYQEKSILNGHTREVTGLALSNNTEYLISSSADQTLRVWLYHKQQIKSILKGHTSKIECVSLTHDNKSIVSAAHEIIIWSFAHLQLLIKLEKNSFPITSLKITKNDQFIITGLLDSTIKIWDFSEKNLVFDIGSPNEIKKKTCVASTSDNNFIIFGCSDNSISFWNFFTNTFEFSLSGHSGNVECLEVSSDDTFLISGSWDKKIIIWSIPLKVQIKTLAGHFGFVSSLAVNSNKLISGSWDNTIIVWDFEDIYKGMSCNVMQGHVSKVEGIEFSGDCKYAISASWDLTLRVWDISKKNQITKLINYNGGDKAYILSYDSKYVVYCAFYKNIIVWDLLDQKVHMVMNGDTKIECIALTIDSNFVVSGGVDCSVRLWNIEKKTGYLLGLHKSTVAKVILISNNKYAVTTAKSETKVWKLFS